MNVGDVCHNALVLGLPELFLSSLALQTIRYDSFSCNGQNYNSSWPKKKWGYCLIWLKVPVVAKSTFRGNQFQILGQRWQKLVSIPLVLFSSALVLFSGRVSQRWKLQAWSRQRHSQQSLWSPGPGLKSVGWFESCAAHLKLINWLSRCDISLARLILWPLSKRQVCVSFVWTTWPKGRVGWFQKRSQCPTT